MTALLAADIMAALGKHDAAATLRWTGRPNSYTDLAIELDDTRREADDAQGERDDARDELDELKRDLAQLKKALCSECRKTHKALIP